MSDDKTPILIYSVTNPTIGYIDTSQKVALLEAEGKKKEWLTIFGK